MGDKQRMSRRRDYLYSIDPYCPQCKTLMLLPSQCNKDNRQRMATIDHINNRYNLEKRHRPETIEEKRRATATREGRTRLLCKQCNERLANEETKRLSKKELWERSGRRSMPLTKKVRRYIGSFLIKIGVIAFSSTNKEKDKIKALERRAAFLEKRVIDSKLDLSYDKQELSSLRWILGFVKQL